MNTEFAPILLFTYKRLDTLKRTITALQQNYLANDSELFIFSDAPKTPKDESGVSEVRSFIKEIAGFKKIHLYEADKNKGLANSIIDGVSGKIKEYGRVIVLEDDLITSANFLSYMNQGLDFYENNRKVFSISGYTIPLSSPGDYQYDTYFLPRASSWGWATWKDQWENVDWDVTSFHQFKKDPSQIKAFNAGGSDMYKMLEKQMDGKIDSWAIRWCYHQFRVASYTAYPIISKVQNIGFDEKATHTNVFNRYYTPVDEGKKQTFLFPKEVEPDRRLLSRFQSFFSLKTRAIGKIKTYLYKAGMYKNN